MRINTNSAALNTYSRLTSANTSKSNSLAKLSSGLRINKAGDDAAGLAISEKMKGQIGGLKQAKSNAQDGISLIQTAEGALNETHSILGRMRDLAVQGSNSTLSDDDRGAITKEFSALRDEIDRISSTTQFNTKSLLGGDEKDSTKASTFTFQIGANANQTIDVNIKSMSAGSLGVKNLEITQAKSKADIQKDFDADATTKYKDGKADSTGTDTGATLRAALDSAQKTYDGADTAGKAQAKTDLDKAQTKYDDALKSYTAAATDPKDNTITKIDAAIKQVSDQRAEIGAVQNRLEHTINNLGTSQENLSAANSRIRDVDMAEEMMSFTKSNILSQAATSMLAQANAMPNSVLSLLQG
ncbi:flagellin [Enterococcus italicus]|uniref:flagellin N-terminal helical domain-containing protein n=1 Tax=Enterococcus italicus TaxID=246144 RepID=UPI0020732D8D|nr:flagellin [Enterococcus italicus]MCM6881379.1 flagellin [Enterococcus italicus]